MDVLENERDRDSARSPLLVRFVGGVAAIAVAIAVVPTLIDDFTRSSPSEALPSPAPLGAAAPEPMASQPSPLTLREPRADRRARPSHRAPALDSRCGRGPHTHPVPSPLVWKRASGWRPACRRLHGRPRRAARECWSRPQLRGVRRPGQRRDPLARDGVADPGRDARRGVAHSGKRRRSDDSPGGCRRDRAARGARPPAQPPIGRARVNLHTAPRRPVRGSARSHRGVGPDPRRRDEGAGRAGARPRRRQDSCAVAGMRPVPAPGPTTGPPPSTRRSRHFPTAGTSPGGQPSHPMDDTGRPWWRRAMRPTGAQSSITCPARSTPPASAATSTFPRSAASAARGCRGRSPGGCSCRRATRCGR